MTKLDELVETTREFIAEEVLGIDDEFAGDAERAGGDALRVELQSKAKLRGIFAPHAPVAYGGLGLGMVERSGIFEESGYSLFGPMAMNLGAPDEGNHHLLAHVATEEQREEFLRPMVSGEIRSAFAMTEPSPGAGSDPAALATAATKVRGGWMINGVKHFITGADGAGMFIIMARTSGQPGEPGGATMFLTRSDAPGLAVTRHLSAHDRAMLGGHCEVVFSDLFVPDQNVLGEVDEGFRYAQVRLGPARMTHVMRWTGSARRAHETAVRYVAERRAFGGRLAEAGMIQQMIADNEIDLAATRALLHAACVELDAGRSGSKSTSIAKTFAAEALNRVVDRSTQMCGGLGVTDELPVAKIARELRPFRIYDGASEVHRWALARRAVRDITADSVRVGSR